MRQSKVLTTVFILGLATMLSGCLGSNGGGGDTPGAGTPGGGTPGGGTPGGGTPGGGTPGAGTPGGGTPGGGAMTPTQFDAKNIEYIFLPSTTQPLTGTADYAGRVSVLTLANDADATEAVYGDLNMSVDFGTGVTNPITGTVGNFAGKVGGVDTVIGGTLSTANALSNDSNSVTTVSSLTSATATFRGAVSDPTGALTGDARMILNGNFKEDGGAKLSGGHQTTILPSDGGTSIATSGSMFADRQ